MTYKRVLYFIIISRLFNIYSYYFENGGTEKLTKCMSYRVSNELALICTNALYG